MLSSLPEVIKNTIMITNLIKQLSLTNFRFRFLFLRREGWQLWKCFSSTNVTLNLRVCNCFSLSWCTFVALREAIAERDTRHHLYLYLIGVHGNASSPHIRRRFG